MSDLQYPPPVPDECRYCGGGVQRMSQKQFYGRDYGGGGMYACQDCEARVGTHKGTGQPLGLLADEELRGLRKELHDLFDPMWKKNDADRTEVYRYFFGTLLGHPEEKQHIGMLTKEECRKAISLLDNHNTHA